MSVEPYEIGELLERLRTPLACRTIDGVDVEYHPSDPIDGLLEESADAIERLLAQLPEGMKSCTILFKECEKGHGRLTATNWIDHGCPTCKLDELRRVHWLHARLEAQAQAEAARNPSEWEKQWPSKPIPPFYVSKTLMGFGGEDLNRLTLHMPADQEFVLCEMNEPRTDVQRSRWNKLAAKLSELWRAK